MNVLLMCVGVSNKIHSVGDFTIYLIKIYISLEWNSWIEYVYVFQKFIENEIIFLYLVL